MDAKDFKDLPGGGVLYPEGQGTHNRPRAVTGEPGQATPGPWAWSQWADDLTLYGPMKTRVLSIRTGVVPMNPDARAIAEVPAMLDNIRRLALLVTAMLPFTDAVLAAHVNLPHIPIESTLDDVRALLARVEGR